MSGRLYDVIAFGSKFKFQRTYVPRADRVSYAHAHSSHGNQGKETTLVLERLQIQRPQKDQHSESMSSNIEDFEETSVGSRSEPLPRRFLLGSRKYTAN